MLRVVSGAALVLFLASWSCQSKTRTNASEAAVKQQEAPGGQAAEALGNAVKNPPKIATPGGDVASPPPAAVEVRRRAEQVLNPQGKPYYRGPFGHIRGIVTLKGDAPPPDERLARVPVGQCFGSHKQLKTAFSVGPNGELADALVAATGYTSQLEIPTEAYVLGSTDCAFARRTVAVMFGQELLVKNHGPGAISPQLAGSQNGVIRFAVPGGHPVPLFPPNPGRFVLMDRTHDFSTADVFALAYPTADVSDEQGRFHIKNVPVGEVTLNAYLPATGQTVEKKLTVVEGQTLEVALELSFKRAEYDKIVKQGLQDLEARRAELLKARAAEAATSSGIIQ
jgi:hypothetical protein